MRSIAAFSALVVLVGVGGLLHGQFHMGTQHAHVAGSNRDFMSGHTFADGAIHEGWMERLKQKLVKAEILQATGFPAVNGSDLSAAGPAPAAGSGGLVAAAAESHQQERPEPAPLPPPLAAPPQRGKESGAVDETSIKPLHHRIDEVFRPHNVGQGSSVRLVHVGGILKVVRSTDPVEDLHATAVKKERRRRKRRDKGLPEEEGEQQQQQQTEGAEGNVAESADGAEGVSRGGEAASGKGVSEEMAPTPRAESRGGDAVEEEEEEEEESGAGVSAEQQDTAGGGDAGGGGASSGGAAADDPEQLQLQQQQQHGLEGLDPVAARLEKKRLKREARRQRADAVRAKEAEEAALAAREVQAIEALGVGAAAVLPAAAGRGIPQPGSAVGADGLKRTIVTSGRDRAKPGRCGGACLLRQLEKQARGGAGTGGGVLGGNSAASGRRLHPEVGSPSFDDESACKGRCGQHGVCQSGKCVCVALYRGDRCERPRRMPPNLHAEFDGFFLFNGDSLKASGGVGGHLHYRTNPKLGSGQTHSVSLPITPRMVKAIPAGDYLGGKIYRKCAIVGNSGLLSRYRFGREIDAHDMVIRFNVAPTRGFEPIVGGKTTLRLVNTIHAGWREGDEVDIQQMQSATGVQLYMKFREKHPLIALYAFDPSFSEYVSSNIKTLPTGGFFAVWLAMQRCARVRVYGFHFKGDFGLSHHYFNAEKPRKGKEAIHDYDSEYQVMRGLASAGALELAEPCVAGCEHQTGIPCKNCPDGSTCRCGGPPLPVAKPGRCRPRGTWTCFLVCPGGASECPGGEATADSGAPAGDCPKSVVEGLVAGRVGCEGGAAMSSIPVTPVPTQGMPDTSSDAEGEDEAVGTSGSLLDWFHADPGTAR